jgi:hypothetical protein
MKNLFLFLCIVCVFVSCSEPKEISLETRNNIKKEINSLVSDWHLAATEANYNNYFNKMDSASIFIGTDAGENWSKEEFESFSKPYFDKGKAWDFKTLERNIYVNKLGEVAWFDELLNTWMGTCRGSGVLEKTGNTWAIKHYVLSVAIPNAYMNKVIEIKKKNDTLFLKKFKE